MATLLIRPTTNVSFLSINFNNCWSPVPAVKHVVASSFHRNTLTITTSELRFKTASQLQEIFCGRTSWVPLKGPVVLAENIRGPACRRSSRHIWSSIWELPLIKRVTELYASSNATYKEQISRICRKLSRSKPNTQIFWSTTASKSRVRTEKI